MEIDESEIYEYLKDDEYLNQLINDFEIDIEEEIEDYIEM